MAALTAGVALGFAVASTKRTSPSSCWSCSRYVRAGLRTDAVLLRINGYTLGPPEEVLQVFARLKDAQELVLEIERGDASLPLTYRPLRSGACR